MSLFARLSESLLKKLKLHKVAIRIGVMRATNKVTNFRLKMSVARLKLT